MRQLRCASWHLATILAACFIVAATVPSTADEARNAGSFEILNDPPALKGSAAEDPMTWSAEVSPRGDNGVVTTGLANIGELRRHLTRADHLAALEAMHYALNEIGDGATFVWNRKTGIIGGMVRPTSSFIDANGAVCRHVVYKLTVANYSKQIEGVACRTQDARGWQISG